MKEIRVGGWVSRDQDGSLHLYRKKPSRMQMFDGFWSGHESSLRLNERQFPDITWECDPQRVTVTIKRVVYEDN